MPIGQSSAATLPGEARRRAGPAGAGLVLGPGAVSKPGRTASSVACQTGAWYTGVVPDHHFGEVALAALCDLFCPREERDDFRFYLPLVMRARAVLDVGCGTGMLLHRAREQGHTGRLCGLGPAEGMLAQTCKRADIEWVAGDLASVTWQQEFGLLIMTGHAFQVLTGQVLTGDSELRAALAAIRPALTGDGRFAFEARNPAARAWERRAPQHAGEFTAPPGDAVRLAHQVEIPVTGDLVRFTSTYTSPAWDRPQVSHSTLRFLDAGALASFLAEAGLAIEGQSGTGTAAR